MKRILLYIILVGFCTQNFYAQDSLKIEESRLDFLKEIDQRKWMVKVPIWVPGFRGTFSYGGLTQFPGSGDSNVIDRLNGEIGVTFYLIGDVEFRSKKWLFSVDGFRTTLASNLKFQNIDKIVFEAAIDGTILRGKIAYQVLERRNEDRYFRAQIYPYTGIRYIDLNIYSEESDILNINPSWFEPLLGIEIPIQFKRWFFSTEFDVGGFSINNHWSWNARANATYRFSKLFALGAGWNFLDFNYDQDYKFKYLNLGIQLAGPVVSLEFHF